MEFVLVRHVETQGNIERRFNGITESEYSPFGVEMNALLLKELKEIASGRTDVQILTSPTRRAACLAETLAESLGAEAVGEPALLEFNFGVFDGLTPEEAEERDREAYFSWMNDHLHVRIPEGDSYEQEYEESAGWIGRLVKQTEKTERETGTQQTIFMISHGATVRCMLTALLDLPLDAGWHIDIPLGGIAIVKYSGDYGILSRLYTPDYQGGNTAGYSKKFIR